ncbi:prim-pol domain-containing protein [Suhomyces tanzawaensis NRRL Y-17324]|uniref:DNA primase n=1 Tax=Suhomyces tanzawaensis NRRL Y-17324 TaxID=984487 RepID=A0A1E4SLD5_9ASCO|nr:prim-pol domain-containing protein [Suhomyces tanzawaensis NRRL Y-17324]ODV80316.1 prim-pol domain-containing protein [Suhomyces tanzawaensis NRRL Y-17324]
MLFFYKRLLPFKQVFKWLSHSPKVTKDFTMREFAFEFRTGAYQRYNSYGSVDEFKQSVINANPTRFEVGAVYAVNPKERKNLPKTAMKPESKELVFDIDLTDYDDIRTCCQKTDICKKCWKFIRVGSKVMDAALRDDFGFKHMVWVFSGRRGAHCWISDPRVRQMNEVTRKSIIDYMDVLASKQSKLSSKKPLLVKRPLHPHVERSLEILSEEFVEIILNDQDPWFTAPDTASDAKSWTQIEELLSFLPDNKLQQELRSKWKSSSGISTSRDKWEDINVVAKSVLKSTAQANQLLDARKDIIIYYMYPRLDVEVSRQVIHLLKSPFCIHPGTGNVCVPFDPTQNISGNSQDDSYGFNPMTAPNLRILQKELDSWEQNSPSNDSDKKLADYERTSLKPYVEYFSKFVNDMITDELQGISKRAREEDLSF